MGSKTYAHILLNAFIFFLTSCGDHSFSLKNQVPNFNHGRDLIAHLDYNLSLLRDLDTNDGDFLETAILINEQIRKTIERITSKKRLKEVHKSYKTPGHDFTFTISWDRNVGVFSWDSRIKGAFHSIRNIALYAKKDKVVPTSLYGEPIVYHAIHKIGKGLKSYYLLQGQGKTEGNGSLFRIDAYSMSSNGMEQAKIFPNQQSSVQSMLDFHVEMDGSLVLQPELWGDKMAFRPLELYKNGQNINYREAINTLDQKVGAKEFERKGTCNFLQGSEIPRKIDGPHTKSFLFEDKLKVQMSYDQQTGKALTILGSPSVGTIQIPWEGKADLVAKKGKFLFFAEEMGANLYNLHLYHTEQKKVKWTRPMSKAYIFDDYILFAEKTESYLVSSAEELSCNSSIGIDKAYFKVYTARYAEEHPIVEFTNQIFCGSSKSTHIATL